MQRTFMATVSPLALALFAALGATQVSAADPIEVQVQLVASIPSTSFFVVPAETGWIGVAQRMEWTASPLGGGKLNPLRKAFDVKNSSGAIAARITDAGGPYLSSGEQMVPLVVRFNNQELDSVTSKEFISATEAAAGKRVDLTIAAYDGLSDFVPGEYSGIVNMTFDAVPPVTR